MSALTWIPAAASLFLIAAGAVPHKVRTDVQSDGFNGSVKTVLSTILYYGIKWRQPDGVALETPVTCLECEYDPDGARVRSGQTYADGFHGDKVLSVMIYLTNRRRFGIFKSWHTPQLS